MPSTTGRTPEQAAEFVAKLLEIDPMWRAEEVLALRERWIEGELERVEVNADPFAAEQQLERLGAELFELEQDEVERRLEQFDERLLPHLAGPLRRLRRANALRGALDELELDRRVGPELAQFLVEATTQPASERRRAGNRLLDAARATRGRRGAKLSRSLGSGAKRVLDHHPEIAALHGPWLLEFRALDPGNVALLALRLVRGATLNYATWLLALLLIGAAVGLGTRLYLWLLAAFGGPA